VTADAEPVLQRFVVGMLERVAPLLEPQVPFMGVGSAAKLPVTLFALVIETVHVREVPVQAPLQPLKVWSVAGVAVKVTLVPEVNDSVQSVGQVMPVPEMEPLPETAAVRVYVDGGGGVT
jgi:hypothetical protein